MKMNKEWAMDRKSQKKNATGTNAPRSKLDVKTYIESQRKKNRVAQNPVRLRASLRAARNHLKTLNERHQIREKRSVVAFIKKTEKQLEDIAAGVSHDSFDATVAPYLELVQQMEEERTKKPGSRPKSRGTKRSSCGGSGGGATSSTLSQPLKHPKTSTISSNDTFTYDESSLRDELGMVLEKDTPPVFVVQGDTCENCNVPMMIMATEALLGCPKCSRTRPYLQATSSRIPYGEEVEFASFSYKRQNHFQEWLNAIQAKENTEVSTSIIEDVMEHMYTVNGIRSVSQITQATLRNTLKQLGMRKQYDHTMQIYVSITGKRPPRFSTFQEEQLRIMFEAIQGPFQKHCPPDRKNFLSYSYCLYKFCELLGYDHFLQYFMLLKGVEKLRKQDTIFKKICGEMDWQFIPSYKEKDAGRVMGSSEHDTLKKQLNMQ
jgi:hypothetical protein